MQDALFERDGVLYRPTDLARGPWSPDALHGGPVAALVAHAADAVAAPGPMHPARLTLDLLRPVPLAPLRATARVVRPGRKVQLVEVSLSASEVEVARGTLLRIRTEKTPLPEETAGGDVAPPSGPDALAPSRPAWRSGLRAYHSHATEHRILHGEWGALGPCTDWIRVRVPLFAGTPLTPFERVAALADFGNGIGAALPFEKFRFINADLTLQLHRLPEGEWVCLDAVTYPDESGVGAAESALFDQRGRIGRALQSLLLEAR